MIVGGGIAGVLAGAQLRKAGIERIRIVDQAGGIGGTWYWNRYPGVMCDVESYIYMPMLEELELRPDAPLRVRARRSGCTSRRSPTASTSSSDALFHTGVDRARVGRGRGPLAGPHRPRRRGHAAATTCWPSGSSTS